MSEFCCDILDDMFEQAGRKGFSVVPEDVGENVFHIYLQARNQDVELKEGKLTVLEKGISYCPFCGTKLSKLLSGNKEKVAYYAARNISLLLR